MRLCARKRRFFIVASILIMVLLIVFEVPCKDEKIGGDFKVSFSRESGFYEDGFELKLETKAGTIYYTLDGSMPDKSSTKYENPILITDATWKENTYSTRTDVSTGFDEESVNIISTQEPLPGYQIPNYKIDKATVIRAAVYDQVGQCRDVQAATYFIGFSDKDGYDGMNTLSIVTDPSNLFDYETGIYVTGKAYDDYKREYRDKDIYTFRESYWSQWLANYKNRGMKWEKKADCLFFDSSGQLILEQECGIRVHGVSTRAYNPKSLNLYARKEYDGNKLFEADFFETGYQPLALTLFQGGNDVRMKVKDYLISDAIKDLKVATMHYKPYVMFLNGEYWGVYWLSEKYDAHFLEYYYGVNKDNVIMIKAGYLEEGEEEDFNYYRKMVEFCSGSDLTKDENYNRVCEMIDMESYLDYLAVMLYTAREVDWPSGNFACWRAKKEEDGAYGDGKWRWMVYDFNSKGYSPELDTIKLTMSQDEMFRNLMTNASFRRRLINRIEELEDTVFEASSMEEKLDEYRGFMSEAIRENDRRFYNDDSLAVFDAEIEEFKNFFYERKVYLTAILNSYLEETFIR